MTSGHLGTAKRQTPAHNGASTILIPPADVVRYTNEDVGSRGMYKQALKHMDCSHSFVFNNEMSRNGRTTPNSLCPDALWDDDDDDDVSLIVCDPTGS